MKSTMLVTFASCALFAIACSTTETRVVGGGDGGPEGGSSPANEDEPTSQPPHALGAIVLGEAHTASSSPAPIVRATFVPDAARVKSCRTKLDANCEVQQVARCKGASETGCGEGEVCTLDDACQSVCKKPVVCDSPCDAEEVCQASGTNATGTCVRAEPFDAGPLAFSGTTTPITMYPPYAYKGKGQGAPFLGGAAIKIQAQGAIGAGFDGFEETFTATTFLQTAPPLTKLNPDTLFGTGAVPIAWVAGKDTIVVTVSGAGGSATCKAEDSLGKFEIPRAAIKAALGDVASGETTSLSLAVARQKKDVKKNKKTRGTLVGVPIQPEGWLELVTVSTEKASFQSCPRGQSFCSGECVDLTTDQGNCGTCGTSCPSDQTCRAGKCGNCDSCLATAQTATCKPQVTACQSDNACNGLLGCVNGCADGDAACRTKCQTTWAAGATKFNAVVNCLRSACPVCN